MQLHEDDPAALWQRIERETGACLDVWMASPSSVAHAALVASFRRSVSLAPVHHPPARTDGPVAHTVYEVAANARQPRLIQRVRTFIESGSLPRRRHGALLLALVDDRNGRPRLPDPERISETEARAWLRTLELGAPDTPGVLAFATLFFDTRPRSLWKPAARVLGALSVWSERTRAHLAPLRVEMSYEGIDLAASGPTVPGGLPAVHPTRLRLRAARASHLRRHFWYLRCARLACDAPDEAPLPPSFSALASELLATSHLPAIEPADASILLDGLGLLLVRADSLGEAARALIHDALRDRRLRYERQTAEVLRSLHDLASDAPSDPTGELRRLSDATHAWLTDPSHVDRDAGVHRVDAAMTLLETVSWLKMRGDHEAIRHLTAGASRYATAIRIAHEGIEPGDDERLVAHLRRLLSPIHRSTTLAEQLHVATVETLALLRDDELGEMDWPSCLARAGAPAPTARPGRLATSGWMDGCLRLFFAGQAPAGLLRDVALSHADLRRVTHALQLRNLPDALREQLPVDPACGARHHTGLEYETPSLQVGAIVRHLAVETDRALARIPVLPAESPAHTGALRDRTPIEQLRLLWSVLEDDPSQVFFEQLHDCLRGSDTTLHRLVRALQHLDWERDRRTELRWAAEQSGDLSAAAPRRADLEAFQHELALVRDEMRAWLDAPDATLARPLSSVTGPLRRVSGRFRLPEEHAGDGSHPLPLFEAFLTAGDRLLAEWDPETAPSRSAVTARTDTFTAYLHAIVAWNLWVDAAPKAGRAVDPRSRVDDPSARPSSHDGTAFERFVDRFGACDVALRAWGAFTQELEGAAIESHAEGLLGVRLRLAHIAQHHLARLPDLARTLHEAAEKLAAIEHEVPWPAREITGWVTWRITGEAEELLRAVAAERSARSALETGVDRALAAGDTREVLRRLHLPRADATPPQPDPIAHLDDARVHAVFWALIDRARFAEANDLRAVVRARIQLPTPFSHLKPLLAACAAGPLLILDIGDEWNAQLATPGFAYGVSYWGLVLGCFALVGAVVYADIPEQRHGTGEAMLRARFERLAATARLLLPALTMSLLSSTVVLLTLEESSVRITDAGNTLPFAPQLLLWTSLSMVLGILLGVVLQGRSLTRRRRDGA